MKNCERLGQNFSNCHAFRPNPSAMSATLRRQTSIFAVSHLRRIAAVDPQVLGHLELRPPCALNGTLWSP